MRPDKKGKPHHHHGGKKGSRDEDGSDSAKGEKGKTKDLAAPRREGRGEESKREEERKEQETEETEDKYARRGVTSNWTKYEIESDEEGDGEEASMTGEDFNYVLQNASGADSLFRLKAEKEWEESPIMITNEFFTLDLAALERDISTIPLNEQLNLTDQDIDDLAKSALREEAENRQAQFKVKMVKSDVLLKRNADEANATILSKLCEKNLSVLPQGTAKKVIEVDKSVPIEEPPLVAASNAEVDNLEEWLDDFLDK